MTQTSTDHPPLLLIVTREGFADQVDGEFETHAAARARMQELLEQHPTDGLSFSTSPVA